MESSVWREMYEGQIDLIDRVIRLVCRRNGLQRDEAEEFRSEVHLKLIDSDYAALRQFDERSSVGTYLTVVIQRLMLDFRTARWGKWRPSEAAKRLGDEAVLLETLLIRDGMEFHEAVEIVQTHHGSRRTRDELYAMTLTFPLRSGRAAHREVSLASVTDLQASESGGHEESEVDRELGRVLGAEVERMDPEERTILSMLYLQGHKISVIARVLGLDQKRLYRTIRSLQDQLRTALEQHGVTWESIEPLLDDPESGFAIEEIFSSRPSPRYETGASSAPGGTSQ